MAKYTRLPLVTKLEIVHSRNLDKPLTYRQLAAKHSDHKLSKSGLCDNYEKIKDEISRLDNKCNDLVKRKLKIVRIILIMVLVTKCSLRDTASAMRLMFDIRIGSSTVQRIMESAGSIAKNLNKKTDLSKLTVASFDEIFQKKYPILGLTDPLSGLIMLRAETNRTEELWTQFLKDLKKMGLNALSMVTDGGTGMNAALKAVFKNSVKIRDLFHVLKKIQSAVRKTEGTCYSLIVRVDKLKIQIEQEIQSGNRGEADELSYKLISLTKKMETAIEIFDDLEKNLDQLSSSVYLGNPEKIGEYITADNLTDLLQCFAAKFESFENKIEKSKKVHAAMTYIKNGLKDITAYKRVLEDLVYEEFGKREGHVMLRFIFPLLEYMDRSKRSYENQGARYFWDKKIKIIKTLMLEAGLSSTDLNDYIERSQLIFSLISRSSSMMECVNSVIRRHLISYKSIPEWFCPLFTFYWNHRIFQRGKRKGVSPVEFLNGDDHNTVWIDEILANFPIEKIRVCLPDNEYSQVS